MKNSVFKQIHSYNEKNTKVVSLVWGCIQIAILYKSINFYKNKKIYSLELFNHQLKLSDVRKALETIKFQELGSFETLGSKLSHGTSSKFADVRTHLRKASKMTLSSIWH